MSRMFDSKSKLDDLRTRAIRGLVLLEGASVFQPSGTGNHSVEAERSSGHASALSFAEIKKVVRDLRDYQAELEIQNAELRESGSQLKQSIDHFSDVYNRAPVGCITLNDQGYILEANPKATDLLGATLNELINRPLSSFMSEKDSEMFHLLLDLGFEPGEQVRFETRLARTDGIDLYVQLDGFGQTDELGKRNGFRLTLSDITRIKIVESQLRNAEARWRFALEGAGDGVWDWNIVTSEVFFSTRWKSMLGYAEHEISHSLALWNEMLHVADRKKRYEELERHFRGETAFYESEHRVLCKDGEYKWILDRGKITEWSEDGKPMRIIGTHADITQRKLAEFECLKREEKHRTVADNTYDCEYWIDADGSLVYISPSCERMTGYRPEDFMNNPDLLLDIVHSEDRSLFGAHLSPVMPGPPHQSEFRIFSRSGEMRWIGHVCQSVYNKEGQWMGRRASNRDITDDKKNEEALREHDRSTLRADKLESLSIMAGGIAHHLNNRLMAVLGNLELAMDDKSMSPVARKRIGQAITATTRSSELTHQILAYTGKKFFQPADLNLAELLDKKVEALKSIIPHTQILTISNASVLPMIRGDEDQVSRALIHLVTNSSEAIGEGRGEIRIATGFTDCDAGYLKQNRLDHKAEPGTFAFLEVADDGRGMDADTLSRFFDPFFSTKFMGRGLGMAETMGVIKSHKGAIILDSKPGNGTTIRLLFPVPAEALLAYPTIDEFIAPKSQAAVSADMRKTILVVEDEDEVRKLCVEQVSFLGYNTVAAIDGKEGLEKFRQNPGRIDLVLLDLIMPGMNGADTFAEMVKIQPDVRVIVSSGYSRHDISRKFIGLRPAGFLQKPFLMNSLKVELDRVIGTPTSLGNTAVTASSLYASEH